MGRRSRKRGNLSAPIERPPAAPEADDGPRAAPSPPAGRRARLEEAPRAPWHPVPLTELCILVGLVVLVVAILGGGGSRGVLLAFGLTLVTLASAELALREHLAGYRSHSALLAGLAVVAVLVPLALLTGLPKVALIAGGVLVFGLAFQALRGLFRRRSGGMGWRA